MLKGGPVYAGSESIKTEFNCDYTHPNAAGYQAMGEFIDLGLFRAGPARNGRR
jgi:lysophospholipase L1-like esterase